MSTGAAAMVGCVGAVVCADDVVVCSAEGDAGRPDNVVGESVGRMCGSVHDRRPRRTAGRNPSSPTEATAGTRGSPPTHSIGRAQGGKSPQREMWIRVGMWAPGVVGSRARGEGFGVVGLREWDRVRLAGMSTTVRGRWGSASSERRNSIGIG